MANWPPKSATDRLLAQQESATMRAVREFHDSPTMRAIREFQDSPAMRAIRELQDSPATRAMRELHDSPAVRGARELYDSEGMRAVRQLGQDDPMRLVRMARMDLGHSEMGRIAKELENIKRLTAAPAYQEAFEHQRRIAELVRLSQPPVLPDFENIDRIAKLVSQTVGAHASIASAAEWQTSLAERMAVLDQPWMMQADVAVSAVGFARVARISDAAHSAEPFSPPVSELLNHELGPVVDTATDEAALATPEERDEVALEGGMQAELIAFPAQSYVRVLSAAGFRFEFVAAPAPVPIEGGDGEGVFDPHHSAVLTDLEQRLRQLIQTQLRRLEGEAWIKRRVPEDVRRRWRERQQEDRDARRPVYELVQYADFMDLMIVIVQRNNWSDAFAPVFRNPNDLSVSLQRLHPVRKMLAHSRPLGRSDVLTLAAEATRILKALEAVAFGRD